MDFLIQRGIEPGAKAYFSQDEKYRYRLERKLIPGLLDNQNGTILFIMLNPSTADAFKPDPTITRCLGFTKKWGFNHLIVVNLFALRSTDPKVLKKDLNPVGEFNDRIISESLRQVDFVVCAWGNHGSYQNRSKLVLENINEAKVKPKCFGLTKQGEPLHPLYQRLDSILEPI